MFNEAVLPALQMNENIVYIQKAKSRVNYIWYRETSATDLIWKRVATPRRVLMLILMFWHVFMCFYNSLSLWLWPLASWALYFLLTYPNLIIWYIWNFIFLLSLLRSILSPLSNTVHSHSFEVNPQSTCPHVSILHCLPLLKI